MGKFSLRLHRRQAQAVSLDAERPEGKFLPYADARTRLNSTPTVAPAWCSRSGQVRNWTGKTARR